MRFIEFLNECGGLKCVLVLSEYKPCTVDFSLYKKYKKYQQGLVKAWGWSIIFRL